ncbi:hypothetical protein GCM10027421_26720 [Microbacterium shaanxiense]
MGGNEGDTRTYVEIDGREYLLGDDQDRVDVMARIEAAARSGPAFVDLTDSDPHISVLVSEQSRIVVTTGRESSAATEQNPFGSSISDWDT